LPLVAKPSEIPGRIDSSEATSVAKKRVGRSDEEDAARPCRLDPQFVP